MALTMQQPKVALLENSPASLHEPLLSGHVMSLAQKHNNRWSWIFDIPFEPQKPEHIAKWHEEHAFLMQTHENLLSAGSRQMLTEQQRESMVEDSLSDKSTSGAIWANSNCVKEAWKYDKDGRNEIRMVQKCADIWPLGRQCADLPEFYWVFGWKHFGPKTCEFGNNPWHLVNWWCPKKSAVEKNDFLNIQNFERCTDDENRFDQLLKSADVL